MRLKPGFFTLLLAGLLATYAVKSSARPSGLKAGDARNYERKVEWKSKPEESPFSTNRRRPV
jgi:hypothetical protein